MTRTVVSQFFLMEGSMYQRLKPHPWKRYFSCMSVYDCCHEVAYRGGKGVF